MPYKTRGLTAWQIVRQSFIIHPDWSPEFHVAYLNDESPGWSSTITLPPYASAHAVVSWWLDPSNDTPSSVRGDIRESEMGEGWDLPPAGYVPPSDGDPTIVTCEGMSDPPPQRVVCRHLILLGDGCRSCLAPNDWTIQTFVDGRWRP